MDFLNAALTEGMATMTDTKEAPKKTRAVMVHLNEKDYQRTLAAADHDGLQTGPWLRMHLLKILRDKDNQSNGQ